MKQEGLITETLHTPVRDKVDVIVAGAGTAGVIAAIAAARAGAKTALIERATLPGGTLLGGGIKWMSFFNAYLAHDVKKKQCVGGIGQELVDRMRKKGFSPGHIEEEIAFAHESVGTQVDRELFVNLLLEIMEEEGIRLFLGTMVVDVVQEENTLQGLILESCSGREALLADCVVDCTGDGDVAALCGVPFENLPERLGIGMMFGMANVDLSRAVAYARENGILSHLGTGDKGSETDRIVWAAIDLYQDPHFADYMKRYGLWGPYILSTHENEATYINGVTTTMYYPNTANPEAAYKKEIPFVNTDGLDARALSRAQVYLYDKIYEWSEMMKQYLPGFEEGYLCWSAPDMGVRSTRCIACEYEITNDHVIHSVMPEDTIGIFGGNDSNFYGSAIEGGKWFGIPYRALVPQKVDGLLVAGRMITKDWVAHMSTRLVGSCFIQGEAAGAAAAFCAREHTAPRKLNTDRLRAYLREAGAILS